MGYNWNIQSLSKRLPLYVILIRLSKAIHAQALSTRETVTINQESRAFDLGFGVLLRVLFITLYATWRRMPVKRISDSEVICSPTLLLLVAVELRGFLFRKERLEHKHLSEADKEDGDRHECRPDHYSLVQAFGAFATLQ